jgi:hypothetical protein
MEKNGRNSQMRSGMIALAMLALVGAGCASAVRYVYIKSGITAEQRDRDESECTRLAMITVGRGSADGSKQEALDRGRLKQCMVSRGYEVQDVKS